MKYPSLRLALTCLAAGMLSGTAHAAPSLADGTWVVVEHCGDNMVTKNPILRQGFDRQTEVTVSGDHIAGHDRKAQTQGKAVTETSYSGTIDGTKITISGTGLRSDQKQPWTYTYEGTTTADGRAELTGGIFMRQASSDQPVKMRACSMTFLSKKDSPTPAGNASAK
jgi:hypothetical protein